MWYEVNTYAIGKKYAKKCVWYLSNTLKLVTFMSHDEIVTFKSSTEVPNSLSIKSFKELYGWFLIAL